MSNKVAFKTNLSLVPNDTGLLMVAESHTDLLARLYIMRSLKYLAQTGLSRFYFEQPPDLAALHTLNTKNFQGRAKFFGKDILSMKLQQDDVLFEEGMQSFLTWEADAYRMKTVYCDDQSFHDSVRFTHNTTGIFSTIVDKIFAEEHPKLAAYQVLKEKIANDFRYACYGEKTFANHAAYRDAPADYKEELARLGQKVRQQIVKDVNNEEKNARLHGRNAINTKAIAEDRKKFPHAKGLGLFGHAHICGMNKNTGPHMPDILQEQYAIPAVKVGISNLQTSLFLAGKLKQLGIDSTLIDVEEVLPFSYTFFGIMPTEMMHAFNAHAASIPETIRDVRAVKGLNLDYEIILPPVPRDACKPVIANKIAGTFAKK